jgi:pumilio RNA-binding family
MNEVYQAAYVAAFYAQQQQLQAHFARSAAMAGLGMGAPPPGAFPGLGLPPGPPGAYGLLAGGMGGMGLPYGGVGLEAQIAAQQGMLAQMAQAQQMALAMGFRMPGAPGAPHGGYGAPPPRQQAGRRGPPPMARRQSEQLEADELEARFGSVAACAGQIAAMARDQLGCRFLQRKFDEEEDAVGIAFPELLADILQLCVDPFGNYLIQKLLDVCTEEQCTAILRALSFSADSAGKSTAQELPQDAAPAKAEEPVAVASSETAADTEVVKDGSAAEQDAAGPAPPAALLSSSTLPILSPAAVTDADTSQLSEAQLAEVLDCLPQLVAAALNVHGTRAVQKLVEKLATDEQVALAVQALQPGVLVLIKDLNGNHVVQRCLQRIPQSTQFIYDIVGSRCVEVATHRHGCCVLQRCIDNASEEQRLTLISEVAAQSLVLAQDPFGNYVVQYVLGLDLPWASAMVMGRLGGSYAPLSMLKFSSNVVEKCLELAHGPLEECRTAIVRELTLSPLLEKLLQDPFGNYVIQCALKVTSGDLYEALVAHIRPHIAAVKSSPYGKRILARTNLLGGRSGARDGR